MQRGRAQDGDAGRRARQQAVGVELGLQHGRRQAELPVVRVAPGEGGEAPERRRRRAVAGREREWEWEWERAEPRE